MKVKIGNIIHDANNEPVMLILSDADKKNISSMLPEAELFCVYPDTLSQAQIEHFMEVDEDPKCDVCGNPATCKGEYEGPGVGFSCDDHCGHGNEDGWCEPVSRILATTEDDWCGFCGSKNVRHLGGEDWVCNDCKQQQNGPQPIEES